MATMQSIQYEYPPQITVLPIHGSSTMLPVRRIYCVGRNYIDHIREMKEADERDPPFFFQKPTDSIVQSGATVPYPPDTQDFQFEVELVVAISRSGLNIDLARASDHILGYSSVCCHRWIRSGSPHCSRRCRGRLRGRTLGPYE